MIKILITTLLLISPTLVFAAPRQQLDDGNGNIMGTSANPVHVNCVSGCSGGGGGGSSLWETNNVGIDTFNNVGIGSTNPGVSLDVQGTVRITGGVLINI